MFNNSYYDWNQKRIKSIVDFYGSKFFYMKRVLDLGCGYGDIGGVLYRLGSAVTAVDARQEHLKIVEKKFPGIKIVKGNLDGCWPFAINTRFDLVLDLGLLCHLSNYEEHLKQVCKTTTHLVLETAVCDSDDDHKCLTIDEDKCVYDLSYNGRGCRPSTAAIERVLTECGMNFKRIDDCKFNSGEYKYDWDHRNNGTTSLYKRKLWFCIKNSSPIQFAKHELTQIGSKCEDEFRHPKQMHLKSSPKQLKINEQNAEREASKKYEEQQYNIHYDSSKYDKNMNDKVRFDSQHHSLIIAENFSNIQTDDNITGTFALNSFSSKMWYKKISPFFPSLRLTQNSPSMVGFLKTDKSPDIIMCSINSLQSNNRIWIDEWPQEDKLSNAHIDILKRCKTIITPSLINSQEILKFIPEANIIRACRPWPMLSFIPQKRDYYLYFEKSPILTKILFDAWDSSFGELVVVGASIKIPQFAKFVSNCDSYEDISKLIIDAKAIIDLSENNYYMSGLLKLAEHFNINVITNNHISVSKNTHIIYNDKSASLHTNKDDIKNAINKYNLSYLYKTTYNDNYINILSNDIKKLLGA